MKTLTAFTRAWYAFEFLRELVLIYPVYAIMIGAVGVTPFELSLLFFAWSVTGLAAEVPSGALADRLPRRYLLVAGQILKASCFLLWWLAPTFAGFLAGFVLWGLGGAMRSGTAEALLFDKLCQHGRPELFVQIYGRSEAVAATAVTLAMAIGGWAAETGFAFPLVLSATAPLAAALIVVVFVDEPPRHSDAAKHESYLETLGAGLGEVRRSTSLRRPILFLCTAALAYEVGEEYFGPLLDEVGFSLAAVGMIHALANLGRAAGGLAAGRLGVTTLGGVSMLYGLGGGLLAVAALGRGGLVVAGLTLFAASAASAKVLLQSRLQHSIEGHARATITSVVGLGQELVGLTLFLAIGAIATRSGWATSFLVLAAALVGVATALGVGAGGQE